MFFFCLFMVVEAKMKDYTWRMAQKISIIKTPMLILTVGVLIYGGYFLYFVLTKYAYGGYNGVDLAIFNNVMWSIVHGNGAWSSIQGHHYFGDHFSLILYLLAPLYALWQDPRMLLIIQIVVFALTAVPVYLIVRCIMRQNLEVRILNLENTKTVVTPDSRFQILGSKYNTYALAFTLAWLFNPLLHNATVFEFHTYSFAVLFLLWAVYWCLRSEEEERNKVYRYRVLSVLYAGLALMTREDVALVVAMMGAVLMAGGGFKMKEAKQKIGLALLSSAVVWFLFAQKIIAAYSPSEQYQFSIYYHWLRGAEISEIVRRVLSFSNINLVLAALLPFLFLPLFGKAKWLLLSLPPAAAALLAVSGGSVVWQTHLIALWLPGIIVATAFGYAKAITWLEEKQLRAWIVPACIFIGVLGSGIVMGPRLSDSRFQIPDFREKIQNEIMRMIPPGASVAVSYQYQAPLSSRGEIYDLRYIWLGTQQYGVRHYRYDDPDYLVFAPEDIDSYFVQFPSVSWSVAAHEGGMGRMADLLVRGKYQSVHESADLVVLQRGIADDKEAKNSIALFEAAAIRTRGLSGGIEIATDRGIDLVID